MPRGVDGLGTIMAGKAAPCVLATPETGAIEGTADTLANSGVGCEGISCRNLSRVEAQGPLRVELAKANLD